LKKGINCSWWNHWILMIFSKWIHT
jgi:hypothetical protein